MSDIKKRELKERIDEIDENVAESFNQVERHFNDIERRLRTLESKTTGTTNEAPKTSTSNTTPNSTTSKRVIGIGFGLIPIYEGQNPKTDYPGFYPNELSQGSFTEKVIDAFTAMGMSREEATEHVNKFIRSQDPRNQTSDNDDEEDEDEDDDEESACDDCSDTSCPSHPDYT